MSKDTRVNEGIRSKEVRVIDDEGKQLGVLSVREAIRLAQEKGFDLVEVAATSTPPVCRIMDYGKYKYQQGKKQGARKTVDVKEVKIRPMIGEHDLQLKVKNIRRFLDDGNKAKVSMFFRGREIVRPELGMKLFEKVIETLEGKFSVEQQPKLEGRSITMVIAPNTK
ncbi:MAG: translation initiation factor IF-3 [Nitrospirales bacterium]|nr:translation initiation factor IF-3 [Nitrospirales bacterium]